jgi:hypothetical protein
VARRVSIDSEVPFQPKLNVMLILSLVMERNFQVAGLCHSGSNSSAVTLSIRGVRG